MDTKALHSWQERAVAAYQRSQTQTDSAARAELTARLKNLIGRTIDSQAVYLDEDTHAAILTVDGVLFHMRSQKLVIVRACPSCGLGRFESAPIAGINDLGFALEAWQPPCQNCEPEDPHDTWL